MPQHPLLNKPAPTNLTLENQNGEQVELSSIIGQGKPVVVFFYPKDESYGCVKEVCSFRDSYQIFQDAGAVVIGVSSDSAEAHKKFASAQNLQFTLLADVKNEAKKAFEVPKTLFVIPGRATYLIDREGIIREVFNSATDFAGHAKHAVDFVQKQQQASTGTDQNATAEEPVKSAEPVTAEEPVKSAEPVTSEEPAPKV
ncbi:2181_t:CDS:2 [Ambispora leptoticha]|uniref:thioredoxin-dependent peroxiredoxin n=1 Tax=Ambispora leptoticha TaxID=144679 RepID=A0A9N8VHA6_9GLOM|nr:2181_t:CDS:2 [Ambispora leptoticha]